MKGNARPPDVTSSTQIESDLGRFTRGSQADSFLLSPLLPLCLVTSEPRFRRKQDHAFFRPMLRGSSLWHGPHHGRVPVTMAIYGELLPGPGVLCQWK